MTSWASPRDTFPESVHALMSLWGGFSQPAPQSGDAALEKRLELDFAAPIALPGSPAPTLTVADLERLLAPIGQRLVDVNFDSDSVVAVTFDETLVALAADKVVLSCFSAVLLHDVLRPLLALLADRAVRVEWASFLRKNVVSPWAVESDDHAGTRDIMATEYAELKAAFPQGQSFLTGPVDGDNYFHFVFDGIDRSGAAGAARVENDSQVSAFLYDCDRLDEAAVKDRQVLAALPAVDGRSAEFETLRTFAAHPHVSFESTALAAATSRSRVAALVDEYSPARFILVVLRDRDFADDASALDRFDGYTRQHRTINYFGEGYAFHQLVFTRAE